MHDQGYRRGVIEGGQATIDELPYERRALSHFYEMRQAGYTGVEDQQGFMEGWNQGWTNVWEQYIARLCWQWLPPSAHE